MLMALLALVSEVQNPIEAVGNFDTVPNVKKEHNVNVGEQARPAPS